MDATRSLTDDQYLGLADMVKVYRDSLDAVLRVQDQIVAGVAPEVLARAGASTDLEERRRRAEESLADLERAVSGRDMDFYLEERRQQVKQLADVGIPFELIARSLVAMLEPLGERTLAAFPDDGARAVRAREAVGWLKAELLIVSGQAFAAVRETMVEDEYQKVIRGLSTPVIEVWEDILIMPLIGVIDSGRARQIMEQLLERIVDRQSRLVILDVTGVPVVDTAVADHLVRTTRAAELVGAHAIVVGISPQVAQTLVRLGVALTGVETRSDLRSGLERAFAVLGYRLVRDE